MKRGFPWTLEEDAWFRVASADFQRYRASGKDGKDDTSFFVSRTLDAWYKAFPERHPRTFRQHSTTAEEANRVIVGADTLRMHERVRHKLNYYKKLVKEEDLTTRMSGRIDLTPGALNDRPTEGYRHILPSSPYGPNPRPSTMESIAGQRLSTWKTDDYSGATDEERAQALRDLPLDMAEIVDTLSRHTGAHFYMIAGYHGGGKEALFYDVLSDRVKSFAKRNNDALDSFRTTFTNHLYDHLATRLSVEMRQAGPTAYGAPDGSYRPWLPRWFEQWQGLNEVCALFLAYTAEWQGVDTPIPWSQDESTETDLVRPERLPEGWRGLPHPDAWNWSLTEQFAQHIWAGQDGGLPLERRFQFRTLTEDEDEDVFQEEMDPDGGLKYGPESRLYVRRLMEATENDLHAQAEVRSHLPGQPIDEEAPTPFDDEGFTELEEMVQGSDVMMELLRLLCEYEQEGPIQAASGHWARMYDTSTHFPAQRPDPQASYDGIGGPWLSAQYYDDAERRPSATSSLSMERFAVWLRSGILVHALTRTILAGPWGVKWPVLVLICAYWTGTRLSSGELPEDVADTVSMPDRERDIILREAIWLIGQLNDSVRRLRSMYELASQQFIPTITGFDVSTLARRFVPPYLRESMHEEEEEEDFKVFYRRMLNAEDAARATLAQHPVPKPRKKKIIAEEDEPGVEEEFEEEETEEQPGDDVEIEENGENEDGENDEEQEESVDSDQEDAHSSNVKGKGKKNERPARRDFTAARGEGPADAPKRHVTWEPGYKVSVEIPKPAWGRKKRVKISNSSVNDESIAPGQQQAGLFTVASLQLTEESVIALNSTTPVEDQDEDWFGPEDSDDRDGAEATRPDHPEVSIPAAAEPTQSRIGPALPLQTLGASGSGSNNANESAQNSAQPLGSAPRPSRKRRRR